MLNITPHLTNYVNDQLGTDTIKFLPQNVKKQSRPAILVRQFANSDPQAIIWLYHPKQRYKGFFIRKAMLRYKGAADWYKSRIKNARVIEGDEYNLVITK